MTVYVTKRGRYVGQRIGNLEVITAHSGVYDGRLYGVVGFWTKESGILTTNTSGGIHFFHKNGDEELRPVSYNEISSHLSSSPEIGSKIVARLLDETNQFVQMQIPQLFLISSKIREIQDNKNTSQ